MSIEIFSKNIARHIDGVIKADDESSLRLELDEYVLTSEVRDRLEDFLEAYNGHYANGAWISGFFGSGTHRSHPGFAWSCISAHVACCLSCPQHALWWVLSPERSRLACTCSKSFAAQRGVDITPLF